MLLLIAANSGVQAQTLANFWLGFDQNLVILPVINKIDLPGANIDSVKSQLNSLFDFDPSEITCISAKSGLGVPAILDLIIDK
jgi:GTP-binding protein LepA